jgi:xanthine dehydrogenase accessory factor
LPGKCAAAVLDWVKAPAGLDLGAITSEEIGLSILAKIVRERRGGQR